MILPWNSGDWFHKISSNLKYYPFKEKEQKVRREAMCLFISKIRAGEK